MAIETYWYNKKRHILLFRHRGNWTWKDFYKAYDQAHLMMYDSPEPVIIIEDLSAVKSFPRDTYAQMLPLVKNPHLNTRFVLIVTGNPVMQAVYQSLRRISRRFGSMSAVVSTVEEALAIANDMAAKKLPTYREAS